MAPRDPRLRPALERALPADDVPGTTRIPDWPELRQVLFGDGEWHPVSVRSWSTDRFGGTVIGVEWYADGSTWGEEYRFDAAKVREI